MRKPIPDKAEVAIEYPDKVYIGTFERTSRFDARFEKDGIALSLYSAATNDARKTSSNAFSLRVVCRDPA